MFHPVANKSVLGVFIIIIILTCQPALSHRNDWFRWTRWQTVQQPGTDRKGTKIEIDMEQSNKKINRGAEKAIQSIDEIYSFDYRNVNAFFSNPSPYFFL